MVIEMFNEKHKAKSEEAQENVSLVFLTSQLVRAYPCGRRRSKYSYTTSEGAEKTGYIPTDPEARLNTEANNRKYTSLNGYTQTYLGNFNEKNLRLVLAGYAFDIDLDNLNSNNNNTPATALKLFAEKVLEKLAGDTPTGYNKLYANIRLQEVKLFSGTDAYYTSVLRDQTNLDDAALTELDVIKTDLQGSTSLKTLTELTNYYFSGLSFSTSPLNDYLDYDTSKFSKEEVDAGDINTRRVTNIYIQDANGSRLYQQVVSLCVLEKDAITGVWKAYEPARLPHIEHGKEEDSVVLNKVRLQTLDATAITSDTITARDRIKAPYIDAENVLTQGGEPVPMIEMLEMPGETHNVWRMKFTHAVKKAIST